MVVDERMVEAIGSAVVRTMARHAPVNPFLAGEITRAVIDAVECAMAPIGDGVNSKRS